MNPGSVRPRTNPPTSPGLVPHFLKVVVTSPGERLSRRSNIIIRAMRVSQPGLWQMQNK